MDGGEIDWGIEESNENKIDFNISLQGSGITVEESGLAGGIAKDGEALAVLDSFSYREQFLDELFEVRITVSCECCLNHVPVLIFSWKHF